MDLYVREATGDYRVARPREVLDSARDCVGQVFGKGRHIEKPAVAAGLYPNLDEAVKNMVQFAKRIVSNPENHEKYKKIFRQYQRAHEQCGAWMHETTECFREL